MATKKVTPKTVQGNGHGVVRAGEAVYLPASDVLIGAPWLNPLGTTRNYVYCGRAGEPTIFPQQAFGPRTDGARQLKAGNLTRLEDATEGTLAEVIDVSDSRARTVWTTGSAPRPNRQERIGHWKNVVVDSSLAECIVNCEDVGLDGMQSAKLLVAEFDRSYLEHRASDRPWLELSRMMIQTHLAEVAGLVPPQGGTDDGEA